MDKIEDFFFWPCKKDDLTDEKKNLKSFMIENKIML